MKKFLMGAVLMTTMGAVAQAPAAPRPPQKPGLTISSPDFEDGAVIPTKFTQSSTVPFVSPALTWTNVPDGTVSFALILNDQDTAMRKNPDQVIHWMIFNIPGTARALPQGASTPDATLADGSIQALNTARKVGYLGMGAPPGPYHHYTFGLFALDTKLALGPDATQKDVEAAMAGHILGKGVVVGRSRRE